MENFTFNTTGLEKIKCLVSGGRYREEYSCKFRTLGHSEFLSKAVNGVIMFHNYWYSKGIS
jgi:hypothetical protein